MWSNHFVQANEKSGRHVPCHCWIGFLALFFSLGLKAEDTWTVPAQAQPVSAEFIGYVEADRGKLTSLLPPGQKLVVSWLAMTGKAVVAGDPVISFDTQLVDREVLQRRAELDEAEAQYRVNLLKLDASRADLLVQAAQARADLATTRAQLAAIGTDDAAEVALARTRADQATDAVARVQREFVRVRVRADAGDASVQQVADAQHVVELAALDAQRAQAVAQRAGERDRSLERERLHLEERRLLGVLGLVRTADGRESEDVEQGLAARISQNHATRANQENSLAAERDARRTAWHETERDLHDHCPLATLELIPVNSASVPLRWEFAPAGSTCATGSQLDDGSQFSATRGWGWDRDVSERMRLAPAAVIPPVSEVPRNPDPANGSGKNPAVSATPAVAAPERPDSWCLVREPAVWTATLPDGQWTLRVRLGADQEWDGALIHADGGDGRKLVYVANRIEAGAFPAVEVPVTVHGGQLRLLIGYERGKHVFATAAGIMTLHPRTERGRKSEWVTRPLAYIVEPTAVRINARIPATVAPLVTASEISTGSDLRARCATNKVTMYPPGLPAIPGTVTQVGTKPVGIRLGPAGWNEEDQGLPQDLTHREVIIGVGPEDARMLILRSRVVLRVSLIPPTGITAIPPWLVIWRDSVAWIRNSAGAWQQVEAERAGPCTLVTGLEIGAVLHQPTGEPPVIPVATTNPATTPVQPPAGLPTATATAQKNLVVEGGFPGEVIAGARMRVTMPGGWGRVATCVADGSEVSVGQELLTLYNPVIEQQKNQLAQARRAAERAYAAEVAARRERLLAAVDQRREHEIAETSARLTVADNRRPSDQLSESQISARRNAADAKRSTELAALTAALAAPPAVELADRQAAAARAATVAERAALAVAQTANSRDWAESVAAEGTWKEALQTLDQREADDVVARGEDRVAAAKAAASLAAMNQGQEWVNDFERNKVLRSTAAGRLYWLLAWNDQTRTRGKLTKDVWVWAGVPVAEIVDMKKLSFTAELPESLYVQMRSGTVMQVRFPLLGDRRFPATVSDVGQALGPSRDANSAASDERITDHRVFMLTLTLDLGSATNAATDETSSVQPGLRGILEYP